MRILGFLVLAVILGIGLTATNARAEGQVGISVGVAPDCPYGYYDYPPYDCAPYGYYGPEWFNGGVFIGVGPWYHGPEHFWGHVDNHFRADHGYHGHLPARGEHRDAANRVDRMNNFHGNEMRDGHGHTRGH